MFSTQASTAKFEISLINNKNKIGPGIQPNCVIDWIKTFWNIKQTGTRYGTIINIL